jgi:hypothetical protein
MILYVVVFATSLWRYPAYFQTPLRWLPVLLMYTLLTETLGLVIRLNPDFSIVFREVYYNNNWLIFNVYSLLFFLYFYFVYHRYLTGKKVRALLRYGGLAYGVAALLNGVFDDFLTQSQVYAYAVGGLVLMGMALAYLWQEHRAGGPVPVSRNLLAWISAGIFVFYLGYTPIKFLKYLVVNAHTSFYPTWVGPVHFGLIYALYGCFFLGLLRMQPMKPPHHGTSRP